MRTLNLFSLSGFPPSTLVSHSCFSSFSSRWGDRGTCCYTAENDGLVKTRANVDIGTLNTVEQHLGDTRLVNIDQVWLEETLGGLETLAADTDDTTVGQGV